LESIDADIAKIQNIWGVFEEFQKGLRELTKEDWVSFRAKTFRFDEFLQTWQDRLKVEITKSPKPSSMQVKIQNDIDLFKVSFDY
jgi:dynein heavy chain 2